MVGLDTRQTMVYQIFTLLFAVTLIGWCWTLRYRDRFSVTRKLPRFATAGEPLSYRLTIRSRAPKMRRGLTLFDELDAPCPTESDFLDLAEPGEERRNRFDRYMGVYRWRWLVDRLRGGGISERPLPPLAPEEVAEVRVSFTPTRRGFLRFKGALVARPDPSGLFFGFSAVAAPDSLLVLPRRYPVPPLRFPGSRRYQSGGVALAGSVGEAEEFVSLRDYRPGDPLRRIHWRSWAKRDKPVIKEYQEEYFVRYALVLDTFARRDGRGEALLEGAVSVAASFACALTTGESLLDILFVGPEAFCFTAGRSVAPVEGALEILASVGASGEDGVSELSDLVCGRAPGTSGCILILLAWDAERRRLVEKLRGLGVPLRVIVMRKGEGALPPGPMAPEPRHLLSVDPHRIAEGLAALE